MGVLIHIDLPSLNLGHVEAPFLAFNPSCVLIGVSGQGVMFARGQRVIGASGPRVIVSSSNKCTGYRSRNGNSIHSRWIAEALT